MADHPSTTIQRVRIGLTGLGFVFLLVLLGAVFGSASEEEATVAELAAANVAAGNASAAEADSDAASEPLAELGVTPGGAPEEPANAAEPAPPARR